MNLRTFLVYVGLCACMALRAQVSVEIESGCKYTLQANLDTSQWTTVQVDTILLLTVDQTPYWAVQNPVLDDTTGYGISTGQFPNVVDNRQWPYVPPTSIQKIPFWGVKCPTDDVPRFNANPALFVAGGLPVISIVADTASLFGPYGIYNNGEGFIIASSFAEVVFGTVMYSGDTLKTIGQLGTVLGGSPLPISNFQVLLDTLSGFGTLISGPDTLFMKYISSTPGGVLVALFNPYGITTPNYFADNSIVTDLLQYPRHRVEKPAVLKLFDGDGNLVYNNLESIAIAGNWGSAAAQKGFQLFFRNEKIEHEWFGPKQKDKFKRLNLRVGGSYSMWGRLNHNIANRLALEANLLATADRPTHLFINGEYWGIYGLEERPNKHHYDSYMGTDNDSIWEIEYRKGGGAFDVDEILFSQVNNSAFAAWYNNINLQSPVSLRSALDEQAFFDYIFHNTFLKNSDWGKDNPTNICAIADPIKGLISHIVVDQDGCFSSWTLIEPYNVLMDDTSSFDLYIMVKTLVADSAGRNHHLNRSCDLMSTAYAPANMQRVVGETYNDYAPYISTYNQQRWGIHSLDSAMLVSQKNTTLNFLLTRGDVYRLMLMQRFGLSSTFEVSVNIPPDTTLGGTFTVPQGTVKWSTLHLDTTFRGIYFGNLPLIAHAIPAPGFAFSHWQETGDTNSRLEVVLTSDSTFTPVFVPRTGGLIDADSVILNEIMVKGDDWVELYNPTTLPYSLDGHYLSDSPTEFYPLPDTVIEANQYIVFYTEPLGFKLDKEGEHVYFISPQFNIIDSVSWVDDEIGDGSKGRSCEGGWVLFDTLTQGAQNDTCLLDGVYALPAIQTLTVWPNPTNGNVQLGNLPVGQQWQLYNALGDLISQGSQPYFSLVGHAEGMYILRIGTAAFKIIKQRE